MGRPKAWLPWFGKTMVEHVVDTLLPLVDEVIVVTSESLDLPSLDATIVRDTEPERGPLAGLRDGLSAATTARIFATSTDAPWLRAAFVDELFSRGRACAPVAGGHVQVLSAVYPGEGAPLAAELLDTGRSRPLDLLEALDYEAIDAASLASVGAGASAPWDGFNTPGAYLDAVRAVDPEARCEVELLGRAALRADEPVVSLPVGSLGDVLAALPAGADLVEGDRVARRHLVSLGGRDLVRDLTLPIGAGERISVLDAQAGG